MPEWENIYTFRNEEGKEPFINKVQFRNRLHVPQGSRENLTKKLTEQSHRNSILYWNQALDQLNLKTDRFTFRQRSDLFYGQRVESLRHQANRSPESPVVWPAALSFDLELPVTFMHRVPPAVSDVSYVTSLKSSFSISELVPNQTRS